MATTEDKLSKKELGADIGAGVGGALFGALAGPFLARQAGVSLTQQVGRSPVRQPRQDQRPDRLSSLEGGRADV